MKRKRQADRRSFSAEPGRTDVQRGYFDGGWKDVGGDGISFDLGGRINLKGHAAETAGGSAELSPLSRDELTRSVKERQGRDDAEGEGTTMMRRRVV